MTLATDLLSADHKVVLKKLKRLEMGLNNIGSDNRAKEYIIEVASFIGHVVKRHFIKEEEILFPLLGKMPGMGNGPLKMLYLEHEVFKSNNEKFQELVERLKNEDDVIDFEDDLVEKGSAVIVVLREHIDKEDQILFPMAERYLGEEILLEAAEEMSFTADISESEDIFLVLDIRELKAGNVASIAILTFDEMPVGNEMKIIDDKNSSRIHEKLEKDRAGFYAWRDEKKGPDTWVSNVKKVA